MTTTMRHIYILPLMILLGSCGIFKKHKHVTKTDEKHQVDSTATVTTTVREKVDTIVVITGTTITGEKPLEPILKGDSLVVDDGHIRVVVKKDPVTGNLVAKGTTKDRQIPISINKEATTTAQVSVRRTDEKHQVDRTKDKKTSYVLPALIFSAIFLGLLFLFLRYLKRRSSGLI